MATPKGKRAGVISPPSKQESLRFHRQSVAGGTKSFWGNMKVLIALVLLIGSFVFFARWTLGGGRPGDGVILGSGDQDAPLKQYLDSAKASESQSSSFRGGSKFEGGSGSGDSGDPSAGIQKLKALLDEHNSRKDKKDGEKEVAAATSIGAGAEEAKEAKDDKEKEKERKKKNQEEHIQLSKAEPKVHNHHPNVSPRPGSDISGAQNQLSILRCPNQSKCLVPELQLKPKNKIYLCKHPVRHGVRFYFLVREGLLLHPNVILVDEEHVDEADYVFYLPGSSPWHRTECTNSSLADKLIVMDEFDGHNLFYPYKSKEEVVEVYGKEMVWYYMYFKRSFVARRDGKFMGHPHLNRPDVYPMTYAIAEAYIQTKFNFVREIEVLCTLRGNARMTTRQRVQTWIAEYTDSRHLKNAVTSQVNGATRTTVSKSYFAQMYNAQIIVTVNPANWEGDFRLWESFATGALIFVDPIFVPHGYPLEDGIHAVFYNNNNRTELFEKLDYYRRNSEVARKIAINGYLHAMKYHRTVNMIDYVLRSAHLKAALIKQTHTEKDHEDKHHITKVGSRVRDRPGDEVVPSYTFTAQYLNHQTQDQGKEIKKADRPGEYKAVVGLHHDGPHEPHSLSHMSDKD